MSEVNKMDSWIMWLIDTLVLGNYIFTFFVWQKQQTNYQNISNDLSEIKMSIKINEINLNNINDKLNSISKTVIKEVNESCN
jgi:hypothetical protein